MLTENRRASMSISSQLTKTLQSASIHVKILQNILPQVLVQQNELDVWAEPERQLEDAAAVAAAGRPSAVLEVAQPPGAKDHSS